MSDSRSFVDTNVLDYAHDRSAGGKHDAARALLSQLWDSGGGCVSVQVLQEFFVTVTRKVPQPLDADAATAVVEALARWRVHAPTVSDVIAAIGVHRTQTLSFWDSMIVCSAGRLGCSTLYTEDLNHGQRYAGVRAHNPFLHEPS